MLDLKKLQILIMTIFIISNAYASTGGAPVDYKVYPYIAATLFINQNADKAICVASIINTKTAITATHCLTTPEMLSSKTRNLYANIKSQLTPIPIAQMFPDSRHGESDVDSYVYDTGLLTLKKDIVVSQLLTVNPNFNPYTYISSQPGQEILFQAFGVDIPSLKQGKIQINTGILSIMNGGKCIEQVQDLINNEGSKFSTETLDFLKVIEFNLKADPSAMFCVFNKKSDGMQATHGDSGSPLVINYNGSPTIAGVLGIILPIDASQNYSSLVLYTNIEISYRFLEQCQKQQSGLINGVEDSPSCETLQQWWEKHRINSNENMFAVQGGLARMVPYPNDVNSMMLIPYFIGIGNLFNYTQTDWNSNEAKSEAAYK